MQHNAPHGVDESERIQEVADEIPVQDMSIEKDFEGI